MTARQLVESTPIRLAVYALALGVAWAELKASVNLKADKAEVQSLQVKLDKMAADVRDVKYILCGPRNTDSFCRAR